MMKDMKNELIKQMQWTEASIKEQFRVSTKETNARITTLFNNVKENSSMILTMKERISKLEAATAPSKLTYAAAIANCDKNPEPNIAANEHTEPNHDIYNILAKAQKIFGLEPIADWDIDDHFTDTGNKSEDEYKALKNAVNDFLTYELKMSDEEIDDLGISHISRNKGENNIKVYIHINNEKMATYLYKKAALVQNRRI